MKSFRRIICIVFSMIFLVSCAESLSGNTYDGQLMDMSYKVPTEYTEMNRNSSSVDYSSESGDMCIYVYEDVSPQELSDKTTFNGIEGYYGESIDSMGQAHYSFIFYINGNEYTVYASDKGVFDTVVGSLEIE